MIDPLTLDQLRVLVAVVETGSFSAAARRLRRVQSAVSQSVQALEGTLRLSLFDRTGRRPLPTEAGRVIIEDARLMLKQAEVLRARADSITGGLEPELTIAINPLMPPAPAMEALKALRQEFPNLPVTLLTEGLGSPERHLRDGTVRLAIYPVEAVGPLELAVEFLMNVPMVPVVAAGHPLAQTAEPLTREQLALHVQLVLTDGGPKSNWSRGVISPQHWRFADLNTRLAFLREGFGWCYMPEHMVAIHIAKGRLKRLHLLEENGFNIPLHVVHERSRPPGVAGRWLINRMRQALARHGSPPPAAA